jgi:acyl-CoA dehydrogenase
LRRVIFSEDHQTFRDALRKLFERDAVPYVSDWAKAGRIPKDFFEKLGEIGLFGIGIPKEYGGNGPVGYAYKVVAWEEAARAGIGIASPRTHTDVVTPYVLKCGNEEQRRRWLPGMVRGTTIAAIAMSEPGTGSDLAGIRTTAVHDEDSYVIHGSKTFITAGLVADIVVVVVRTGPQNSRRDGLTLLVVEDGMPGFDRGRPLAKIGLQTSDTAELTFQEVRVPVRNRLGEEGRAFEYLTSNLPQERIAISAGAVAMAQTAIDETIRYVKDRDMFGTSLAAMQNTKFVLAGLSAKAHAAQAMLDLAVQELDNAELTSAEAARVKLFCTEVQGEVVDACLQLHGGYGYIRESPIAQMYLDARVSRIYGGSSEVMKVIIARDLGLSQTDRNRR